MALDHSYDVRGKDVLIRFHVGTLRDIVALFPYAVEFAARHGCRLTCAMSEHHASIKTRQVKYLNNIVEQDHRAVERMIGPMLGCNNFWSAATTIAGIEIMHVIRKGQLRSAGKLHLAQQFYSLAAWSRPFFLGDFLTLRKFATEPILHRCPCCQRNTRRAGL